MPQNSAVDGEGDDVDVIVEVAVSGVTESSEDSLKDVEMEVAVDVSLDDEELDEVPVVVSLVDVDNGAGEEEDMLMAMEVDELEAVLVLDSLEEVDSRIEVEDEALLELELKLEDLEELAEDTTASHFPNPAWQPVPQYALPLPQYEYCEQQSPYFPPEQVIPAGDAPYRLPQRAFVVTLTFAPVVEGAADEVVRVEVEVLTRLDIVEVRAGATTPMQVPNDDWQPVPQ